METKLLMLLLDEGGLVDHGKSELERAGLLDKDSDYDGMLGEAVLELLEVLGNQGHSGMSANLTIELFTRLAKYEPLTEITDDPSEWMHICDARTDNKAVWQSNRNPALFSNDGGKNYYSVDDPKRELVKAKQHG